jgi:hypothetical protein
MEALCHSDRSVPLWRDYYLILGPLLRSRTVRDVSTPLDMTRNKNPTHHLFTCTKRLASHYVTVPLYPTGGLSADFAYFCTDLGRLDHRVSEQRPLRLQTHNGRLQLIGFFVRGSTSGARVTRLFFTIK